MQLHQLITYLIYATAVASMICSWIASANLAPGTKKNAFKVLFWRPRADFTDKGWKFRQLAAYGTYLCIALMIGRGPIVQFLTA